MKTLKMVLLVIAIIFSVFISIINIGMIGNMQTEIDHQKNLISSLNDITIELYGLIDSTMDLAELNSDAIEDILRNK